MPRMYIRKTKIKSGPLGEPYYTYRLVESIRTGKTVKQRTIVNLGKNFAIAPEHWPVFSPSSSTIGPLTNMNGASGDVDISHWRAREPILMIASPGSGHGKTTLTALLARLHRNRGRRVQVFKMGPDFLDPMIHECASGQTVFNIDLWMVGERDIRTMLHQAASSNELIIIECAMGLFDGQIGNTSADLARLLGVPIVVVINTQGIAQTFGAIAHGLQSFQPDLPFGGVIANGIGSPHHYQLIRQGTPVRVPLIAGIPRDERLTLPERHLGLVQASELTDLDQWLDDAVGFLLDSEIARNLERLPAAISFAMPRPQSTHVDVIGESGVQSPLAGHRIAIARDNAFGFIYPSNLELLRSFGAELIFFSPLNNDVIPDCDGVWLPGGYPELFADQLSRCRLTQGSLKTLIDNNTPVLAECGGMLFLLDELESVDGVTSAMCGFIPVKAQMKSRFQGLGLQTMRWPEGELRGHTFHHSEMLISEELLRNDRALEPIAYGTRQRNRNRGEALYQYGSIRCSYFHAYFPSNRKAIIEFFSKH